LDLEQLKLDHKEQSQRNHEVDELSVILELQALELIEVGQQVLAAEPIGVDHEIELEWPEQAIAYFEGLAEADTLEDLVGHHLIFTAHADNHRNLGHEYAELCGAVELDEIG